MQWNAHENAGFSKAAPWNPVGPRFRDYNVAAEREDPDSILNFYHRLLSLRHTKDVLLEGDYVPLNENDADVLSYLRRYKEKTLLVVLNMSSNTRKLRVPLPSATALLASPASRMEKPGEITLEPFGLFLAERPY
jgi:glycosidase